MTAHSLSSPTRHRAKTWVALATATLATLTACGGSARSSMRPIVDDTPNATAATTTTTARGSSVTGKIATPPVVTQPASQGRTPGASSETVVGNGGAGGTEDLGGDFGPPSTDAGSGGGAGDAGTGGTGGGTIEGPTTTTTTPGTILVAARVTGSYGTILTDGVDHTLYASAADVDNVGACVGACAEQWVPIEGTTLIAKQGVDPELLGAITRSDGIVQATYNGHPLYRLNNEPLGEVLGQGDGNTWHVVDAATGALVGA